MARESNRANRPFWMHQMVEYVIGAVFISTSIQSETPALPASLGVAVMLNAAFTHGPAGAFRVLNRQVHRIIDLLLIAAVVVAAVQPVVPLGDNARLLMGALGFVLAFVWWNTDFTTRKERRQRRSSGDRSAPARPTSEEVGQKAGRVVGDSVNFLRRAKENLTSDDDGTSEGGRPAT